MLQVNSQPVNTQLCAPPMALFRETTVIASSVYRLGSVAIFLFLLSFILVPNTSMSEAEVRFGVTNPILGAIAQCTNTVLASEESISTYEESSEARDVVGETSHTPSQQKSISKDVRPDYVIYTLASRSTGSAKISMIEVKRKSTLVNDRSICQTIGYNIATRYSLIVENQLTPPLLIPICEDELKFIFFPFVKDGSPCNGPW